MTLVTQAELARIARVNRSSVARLAERRGWERHEIAGRVAYRWSDVAAWVLSRQQRRV